MIGLSKINSSAGSIQDSLEERKPLLDDGAGVGLGGNFSAMQLLSSIQRGGVVLSGRTTSTYPNLEVDTRVEMTALPLPAPFAQRFTRKQATIFEERLLQLPSVAERAALIAADLKTNPYKTPSFFDKDVETTVFYALREGILTEFEAANILLFKITCDAYGRENVKVHFLKDEKGAIDDVEWGRFIGSGYPLVAGLAAKKHPGLRFLTVLELTPALREVSLPRHQFLFFSVPEEEQTARQKLWSSGYAFTQVKVEEEVRRMVMTPQLLQEHFYKLLPKTDQPRAHLVFRPASFGRDFCEREVFIPSSLQEITTRRALDFYDEDLYWFTADLCNPHLSALQELWEVVQQTPHNSRYPYREHNCLAYRKSFSEWGLEAPLRELFWEALVDLLAAYTFWFVGWEVSALKVEFRGLIVYIGENSEKWEREYGITLESLAKSDFEVTYRTKFVAQALRELAVEYLEELTFWSVRKKARNVMRGFLTAFVYCCSEETGGD